jgi:hypothetical protein
MSAIGLKLNNARAETVAEKPSFKSSFERHRCLIPASGFYEWQAVDEAGKTRKQPWYIRPAGDGEFLAMAGLLAAWRSPQGADIVSTCVITTTPNELMAHYPRPHAGAAGARAVRRLARPGLARCRSAQALVAAGTGGDLGGACREHAREQCEERR